MNRCLYCYKELQNGEHDYHKSCVRKFYGSYEVPEIPYSRNSISQLAKELVLSHTTVTGVQPKLSLHLSRGGKDEPDKLTLVDLWGTHILKPQAKSYPFLPENEDLIMHLAELAGIKTVPHTLAKMADGEICYLTRRIDRTADGSKIPMEDACQLTERMTEDKYHSSYEQIAKVIAKHSFVGKLDLVNFWELVVFSWLTGNSDMHLKNFSLWEPTTGQWQLAPAYDLLSVRIALPADNEELALTLNGRRRKITVGDFEVAMSKSGIESVVTSRIMKKMASLLPKFELMVKNSFLPQELQLEFLSLLKERISRIAK